MAGLAGKVAVITGAASGIGRATAERFAAEGARVVLADIQAEAGQRVAAGLPEALFVQTDVSKPAQVQALVEQTLERFGRLDIMVNNAGIAPPVSLVPDTSLDDWHAVFAVNLEGIFLGMKYAIPAMLDSGGGAIVNTASIAGLVGFPSNSIYATAKAGVVHLTKVAALEYARRGIRVNAIAPGAVDTPLLRRTGQDSATSTMDVEMMSQMHPMPGLIPASQIAAAALFLASDQAAFITGVVLPVDGGYSAE